MIIKKSGNAISLADGERVQHFSIKMSNKTQINADMFHSLVF